MYKIAPGSELKAKYATKSQANFQGPFLALSSEGINPKCRLRQEKQRVDKTARMGHIHPTSSFEVKFESNKVV